MLILEGTAGLLLPDDAMQEADAHRVLDEQMARLKEKARAAGTTPAAVLKAWCEADVPEDDAPKIIEGRRGRLRMDLGAHTCVFDEIDRVLTSKEFALLAYLAAHPGQMITRDTLMHEVWDCPAGYGDRTVDVHIRRLRIKLDIAPKYGPIETVCGPRGGYRYNEA